MHFLTFFGFLMDVIERTEGATNVLGLVQVPNCSSFMLLKSCTINMKYNG